jgi:hypothetical protein
MKKWLVLAVVLGVPAVSYGTVISLEAPSEGEPGSASNPLKIGNTLYIPIVGTEGDMCALAPRIRIVSGPAKLVDAIKPADLVGYPTYGSILNDANQWVGGWQWGLSFDPAFSGDRQTVEIGLGQFGSRAYGDNPYFPMGYVTIECTGYGPVVMDVIGVPRFGCIVIPEDPRVCDLSTQYEGIEYPCDYGPEYGAAITIYQEGSGTCWDPGECAGQASGDATCDGQVNLDDLAALKAAWNAHPPWTPPYCCADFSRDDYVNLDDLAALRAGWGTSGYTPSTGNQDCP